jgi:hypothetical protein
VVVNMAVNDILWSWVEAPDEFDPFFANVDYKLSTLEPYLLLGPTPVAKGSGVIVLNAQRWKLSRIESYGCLPVASNQRYVNVSLKKFLTSYLDENEVQFYPVTVKAKDGDSYDFCALVILNSIECTDIEKSKINIWFVENKVAASFSDIVLRPNCLGEVHIAVDSVTGSIIISAGLKKELEATNEKGLHFIPPFDLKQF